MRCMINFARRAAGVSPLLGTDSRLMTSAERKAADIVRCQQFSHTACGRPVHLPPAAGRVRDGLLRRGREHRLGLRLLRDGALDHERLAQLDRPPHQPAHRALHGARGRAGHRHDERLRRRRGVGAPARLPLLAGDPEQLGLRLTEVAPAGDPLAVGDEHLAVADRGRLAIELDLHEAAGHRDDPGPGARWRRGAGLARAEVDEVDPQVGDPPSSGIVCSRPSPGSSEPAPDRGRRPGPPRAAGRRSSRRAPRSDARASPARARARRARPARWRSP